MSPYYDSCGVTIYHMDSTELPFKVIPQGSVLVTDPPFGIDGGRGRGNRTRGKAKYLCTGWEDTRAYVVGELIPSTRQLMAHERVERGAITPGVRLLGDWLAAMPAEDVGCFYQPAAVGYGPWGAAGMNPILYYGRDTRRGVNARPTSRVMTEVAPTFAHPCPKPVRTWTWLVEKVVGKADGRVTVIDPFMGSGTTMVAAKNMGHAGIGVEIEEAYCELAAKRLEQGVLDLFPANQGEMT